MRASERVSSPFLDSHLIINPNYICVVTLTPEVDNQVTSTVEGGTCSSTNIVTVANSVMAPSTVIPPTTIVCLPSSNPATVPPPPTTQLVTNQAVSSSALPYIALTTNTPVRAVPTKTQVKVGVEV